MLLGSRKSIRRRFSAMTIAYLPSGVKYKLYGSSTRTGAPLSPVSGSIGVRLFPELFATHSVFMSYDGTTCCGTRPVLNVRTTSYVLGSITVTLAPSELGT